MNTKNILITGARAPSTLELARLFSSNGHRVHLADSFKQSFSKKSSFVEKFHLTHKPKQETEFFVNDLINVIKNERIELLIPTCEEIFYIAKFKDEIEKYCEVFVDSFDKLIVLHDKNAFIELAKSFGLNTPKTKLISSIEDFNNESNTDHRSVMKPVFSRFSNELLFLPHDKNKRIEISDKKKWVIQEFLEGEAYCSYAVAKDGVVLASSIYKSEIRAGVGATIHFSAEDTAECEEWVRNFVKAYNFTGQISFDFIKSTNSTFMPIECNPRLTSGVHLFRGTNLSDSFINNKVVEPNRKINVGLKLAMILYAKSNIKFFGFNKYIKEIFNTKDVVFDKNDIRPVLYQIISYYHIYKKSKKLKISLLEATTYDISWDGD